MKNNKSALIFGVGLLIFIVALVFISIAYSGSESSVNESSFKFDKFDSKDEYKNYIQKGSSDSLTNFLSLSEPRVTPVTADSISTQESMDSEYTSKDTSFNTRQTNTQEKGVGEADIVKVLDNKTYYAQQGNDYTVPFEPRVDRDIKVPEDSKNKLYGISNPNKEDFNISSRIDMDGKILRNNNTLIVYNDKNITGFNININDSLSKSWNRSLNESNDVVTTRRVGSKAYFIVKESVNSGCIYEPIGSYSIDCTDIYKPNIKSEVDTTYTVFSLDMYSGELEDETSFIGSNGKTSVYMSSGSVYISYEINNLNEADIIDVIVESKNLSYSDNTENRLKNLKDYDISNNAKMTEVREIVKDDDNLEIRDIQSVIDKYIKNNKRDLFRTSIVKLDINNNIQKANTGTIPGTPLNQFSFDEDDGKLRIATTVRPSDRDISANDVYILNEELDVIGSEKNMAKGQRIYAVRFIGDKGYIITYRQVDPLHVLDLSDSTNPKEVGKLKLPGFSEYLHKVGDGLILGVGESQNSKGKLVLFDVSDASNPRIADDLILNDTYSTEVSNNHHAFMQDSKMNNVYIPSNNKMFVVDYNNNELDLVSKIDTNSSAKRTRIYEDDIVVFSSDSIMRVNRNSYDIIQKLNIKS